MAWVSGSPLGTTCSQFATVSRASDRHQDPFGVRARLLGQLHGHRMAWPPPSYPPSPSGRQAGAVGRLRSARRSRSWAPRETSRHPIGVLVARCRGRAPAGQRRTIFHPYRTADSRESDRQQARGTLPGQRSRRDGEYRHRRHVPPARSRDHTPRRPPILSCPAPAACSLVPCPSSLRSDLVSPARFRSAKPQPSEPVTDRIAMPRYEKPTSGP